MMFWNSFALPMSFLLLLQAYRMSGNKIPRVINTPLSIAHFQMTQILYHIKQQKYK